MALYIRSVLNVCFRSLLNTCHVCRVTTIYTQRPRSFWGAMGVIVRYAIFTCYSNPKDASTSTASYVEATESCKDIANDNGVVSCHT